MENGETRAFCQAANGACQPIARAPRTRRVIFPPRRDTEHVKKALNSLEFLVVQEIFMSETAKFANVVLPGASFFEKSGTFTDGERRDDFVHALHAALAIGEGAALFKEQMRWAARRSRTSRSRS